MLCSVNDVSRRSDASSNSAAHARRVAQFVKMNVVGQKTLKLTVPIRHASRTTLCFDSVPGQAST
jgi:hypothetical protein